MRLEEFVKSKEMLGKIRAIPRIFKGCDDFISVDVSSFLGVDSIVWHPSCVEFKYRHEYIKYYPAVNKALIYGHGFAADGMRGLKKAIDEYLEEREAV